MFLPRDVGLLIIALACVVLISVLWTSVIGAAWSPTSLKDGRSMLEIAGVGPDDTVYDLGSGDGRIVVVAASSYKATAVGIEADPLRVAWSRFVIRVLHLGPKAHIVRGNFFLADLSKATVVTMFLTQGTNQKLKSKLQKELRPGTRVVSNTWTFDGWTPTKTEPRTKAYLYVIGEEVPGPAAPSE
jgi:hypothetical protein